MVLLQVSSASAQTMCLAFSSLLMTDTFSGSDDQQTSPSSHSIVVQPSGGIAAALNHALAILEPPPVPSADSEEQRARVAALVTAAAQPMLSARPCNYARETRVPSRAAFRACCPEGEGGAEPSVGGVAAGEAR